MNINQAYSAIYPQRYVASANQYKNKQRLINFLNASKKFKSGQFSIFITNKNAQTPCLVIHHGGHELQPQHINHLMELDNNKINQYIQHHYSSDEQRAIIKHKKIQKLIEIIKGNKKIIQEQISVLVKHKNLEILCALIEHRGHLLQENDIEILIKHNEPNINLALFLTNSVKLSEKQKRILLSAIS